RLLVRCGAALFRIPARRQDRRIWPYRADHRRRGRRRRQDRSVQGDRQVRHSDFRRRSRNHWRPVQAAGSRADGRLMLETIASSSFGFWTIAALIVVLDSIVLLAPGEFVFAFDRRGKATVRAAASPYLVRNKDLSFATLVFFARPFFVSSAT